MERQPEHVRVGAQAIIAQRQSNRLSTIERGSTPHANAKTLAASRNRRVTPGTSRPRRGRKKEPNTWPLGDRVPVGLARSGGCREALLRLGLAGLGGAAARGVTAVTTTGEATRRSRYVASSGRPGGRVPESRGLGTKVRRPWWSAGAGGRDPNKGGSVGILGETRVDARREAGAAPSGDAVRG